MSFASLLIVGALAGLGATILADVFAVLRQGWAMTHGFYCLVGRWVGSLPRAGLAHKDLRSSTPVAQEAALGWAAHIALGILYGMGFVVLFGQAALDTPQIWKGLSFGVITILVPWLIFQPLFGWGIAMSKAPGAWKTRVKGLSTHAVFGLGLWVNTVILKLLI